MKSLFCVFSAFCFLSDIAFAQYVDIAHTTVASAIYSRYRKKALVGVIMDNRQTFLECDVDKVDPDNFVRPYDLVGCEQISKYFVPPGQASADRFNQYFMSNFASEFQEVAKFDHLEGMAKYGLAAAAWAALTGALSYYAVHRAIVRGFSPENVAIRSSLGTAVTLLGFVYFGYFYYLEQNAPIPSLESRMRAAFSKFVSDHPSGRKSFPDDEAFYTKYYEAIRASILEALKQANSA